MRGISKIYIFIRNSILILIITFLLGEVALQEGAVQPLDLDTILFERVDKRGGTSGPRLGLTKEQHLFRAYGRPSLGSVYGIPIRADVTIPSVTIYGPRVTLHRLSVRHFILVHTVSHEIRRNSINAGT